MPAATQSFSGAPEVATFLAASVDGGVTPWSSDDTSTAFSMRPIAGGGSSPMRRRYTASANDSQPIISSTGYPRIRIALGAIEVSAVFQRPSGVREWARRSMSETVPRVMGPSALDRAVKAVAEVTESWNDVLVIVETTIDDRSVDRDVWIVLLDRSDPFRRGDDADDADMGGAGLAQQLDAGYGAAAGGQHRVDHQHETRPQTSGQLGVVARGDRCQFITLQADVPDARVRHQFQDGIEHTQAGT